MKIGRNILILFLCIGISSCESNRKVLLAGYAYRGDHIIIKTSERVLYDKKTHCSQAHGEICALNDEIILPVEGVNSKVIISLTSNGLTVIDTSVLILKNNQKPMISFIHPKESSVRTIFIGDEMDGAVVK